MTNIAEILKNCSKGTKLYSLLCGECELYSVGDYIIEVIDNNVIHYNFYSDGTYVKSGECLLFPSKEQRDWSKFQKPFKDGDVISNDRFIAIFHKTDKTEHCVNFNVVYYHCWYNIKYGEFQAKIDYGIGFIDEYKYATEEEKQKLFDVIKDKGYKWNAETKTLEKLVKPKFKVGDRVKHISAYTSGIVIKVEDKGYYIDCPKDGGVRYISFILEKDYELIPNKFDINTLVPFESRVLVRDGKNEKWQPTYWGFYDKDSHYYPYKVIGGRCSYCIPYEGNEHLLSTTNDCDDFYKTWKS